ncbi:uncharacterized protein METZ01_LOCUS439396 [marine metagenome]|uniref:Uncharacterized protein n=1 Tax=marine metagenome TaxID=408172 RepID=A0A382YTE8_9ZZZZ
MGAIERTKANSKRLGRPPEPPIQITNKVGLFVGKVYAYISRT